MEIVLEARGLMAGDAQGTLELRGEFAQGFGDARRLFHEGCQHAVGGIRFVTDEFHRSDDEGELVIDVVAHGRKLAVQLGDLFDRQSNWLIGQRHGQRCAEGGGKGKPVSGAVAG